MWLWVMHFWLTIVVFELPRAYFSLSPPKDDMRTRKYIDFGVITHQFPCAIPVVIYYYAKRVSIPIATENYKVWASGNNEFRRVATSFAF